MVLRRESRNTKGSASAVKNGQRRDGIVQLELSLSTRDGRNANEQGVRFFSKIKH